MPVVRHPGAARAERAESDRVRCGLATYKAVPHGLKVTRSARAIWAEVATRLDAILNPHPQEKT